jgi:glycosyltransferase involved in cell wall biosynthesis
MKDPVIALAVIARDEARCIGRCLASATPFVDRMLVLDTGSRDDTPRIAAAAGASVRTFAWCDDFSAARNFALAQVETQWAPDWVLMLDADEWIAGGGAETRALLERATPFSGRVLVLNEFDDAGAVRIAASRVTRLLPRGARYRGRVHEQPVVDAPVRDIPLRIGHDGYREAALHAKSGRNEALLRRELQAAPRDPYPRYQLGKDLEIRGRFAEAGACYAQARALLVTDGASADGPGGAGMRQRHPWMHDLVVRQVYCGKRAGDLEAARERAMADAAFMDDSPDFHFALGDLLLECAIRDPASAAGLLPRIEASWLRCLEIGERPDLEGAVQGRGSFLAAGNLAAFHEAQGRHEIAERHRAAAREMQARSAQGGIARG